MHMYTHMKYIASAYISSYLDVPLMHACMVKTKFKLITAHWDSDLSVEMEA